MAQSVEKALAIAEDCARAKRLVGHLADVPYSQAQLCEVIDTLLTERTTLRSEVTLANRRYSATNAQLAKYKKKLGISNEQAEEVE